MNDQEIKTILKYNAIGFANWVNKHYWDANDGWHSMVAADKKIYTTEELYEIYLANTYVNKNSVS